MLVVSDEATARRTVFFEAIYGDLEGYLCLSTIKPGTRQIREEFFRWPDQKDQAMDFVQKMAMVTNVYYCVNLMGETRRVKENALNSWVVWADLDSCQPEKLSHQPTFVIETSPNRYQALWKLTEEVSAFDAEDVSRRIAYKYADEGCDKGGWDITQLLRVPFTINHKYGSSVATGPTIKVVAINRVEYDLEAMKSEIPQVADYAAGDIPMPQADELPTESAEEIMEKHKQRLQPLAFHLFSDPPKQKSWSESLWQLELFCIEAGMSNEETFVVARECACNKYRRDNISDVQLWKEVCRASMRHVANLQVIKPSEIPPLLTDEDRAAAEANRTFVEEYMDWAKQIGDAAPQYHQAGAFVILASLLAGPVKLPTSFGLIIPNIWFMILADTTLTRKTTAMDLAMDIVTEIDSDAMMATDGSIEGLFAALQFRPGRPSVFLRDEFSGLLEQMTKKDYYAGMAETLTKLYDGKYQKRILRRDIIEVKDPVLILFAGGIRERILQLLQYEHIASGFLPRFVFITAESDLSRIRPLGPPTDSTLEGRAEIVAQLTQLHTHYTSKQLIQVGDKQLVTAPEWVASLTPEAWNLYNHYENKMMAAALASKMPDLMTPMFDRLSKSALKASLLLAALRMESSIRVTAEDINKGFYFAEYWRGCALEVVENLGRSTGERLIQNVLRGLRKAKAGGLTRSEVMQNWHLDARNAENVLMTLEQRGLINRRKSGRTEWLYPTVIPNQ
jgi:hypothetical protein